MFSTVVHVARIGLDIGSCPAHDSSSMSRSHAKIMDDAGGVAKVREAFAEEGIELPDPTARSWPNRPPGDGNIPPEYWPVFVKRGWATLQELVTAVERRKFPGRPPTLSPEASAA
jgi:hypothetical protein